MTGVYGNDTCGAACLNSPFMMYGACCTEGTREGEDSFYLECEDGGGQWDGAIPGSPLEFNSYWNCDACGEILGSCCLNSVVERPGRIGGWVWWAEAAIWPKNYGNDLCPSSGSPAILPSISRTWRWDDCGEKSDTGITPTQARSTSILTRRCGSGRISIRPRRLFNPPVIVNARVIGNDDQSTACASCVDAGGYFVPGDFPNISSGAGYSVL